MTDDLEQRIARYLDGTASDEEVRQLDERLRTDPEIREALLDAADFDAAIRESLHIEQADPSAPPPKYNRRRSSVRLPQRGVRARRRQGLPLPLIAAAAVVLIATTLFVMAQSRRPRSRPVRTNPTERQALSTPNMPDPAPRLSAPASNMPVAKAPSTPTCP